MLLVQEIILHDKNNYLLINLAMSTGAQHSLAQLLHIFCLIVSVSGCSLLGTVKASKELETPEDWHVAQLADSLGKRYQIIRSPNYDDRQYKDPNTKQPIGSLQQPTLLVLHYTACEESRVNRLFTNSVLCKRNVSPHYLVNREGHITRFVPEDKRAWHAGYGIWHGETDVNTVSIGIETINLGYRRRWYPAGTRVSGSNKEWYSYDERLFQTLAALCKDIVERYDIQPRHIIGHSDMSTCKNTGYLGRNLDPGPLFPWERLYREYGIGAWYDLSRPLVKAQLPKNEDEKVQWMQIHLLKYGYTCPQTSEWDEGTQKAVITFQMHFRPTNISGEIDDETIKILAQLVDKYCE